MPPSPSNRISGRIFYRIFKRLKTCRLHHSIPPTCSRKFEWYCYFAWIYFDKFSFSTRKQRNCDRILIFEDIIYGKPNWFCPPPRNPWGKQKFSWGGGGICPPQDTQTTSLFTHRDHLPNPAKLNLIQTASTTLRLIRHQTELCLVQNQSKRKKKKSRPGPIKQDSETDPSGCKV